MRNIYFFQEEKGALAPIFALMLLAIVVLISFSFDFIYVQNKVSQVKPRIDAAALSALTNTSGLKPGESEDLLDEFETFFNSQTGDSSGITLTSSSMSHQQLDDGTENMIIDYEVSVDGIINEEGFKISDQVVLSQRLSQTEGCDPNVTPVGRAEEVLPGESVRGTHNIRSTPNDRPNVYKLANMFHQRGALWKNSKIDLTKPGQYKALIKSLNNDHIAFGFHNDPRGLSTIPTSLQWRAPGTIRKSIQLLVYGRNSRSVALWTDDWGKRCCWNTHHRSSYDYDNFEEIILTWDPDRQELSYRFHHLQGTMKIDLINYLGASEVYMGLHAGTGGYPGTHMGCIYGTQQGSDGAAFISK